MSLHLLTRFFCHTNTDTGYIVVFTYSTEYCKVPRRSVEMTGESNHDCLFALKGDGFVILTSVKQKAGVPSSEQPTQTLDEVLYIQYCIQYYILLIIIP